MLAIRMQRRGRRGHAQFRVVVQDARFSPDSGRVVEYLGSYNPHTKSAVLDGEKVSTYLKNGAQPSDRVARLLQQEGIKLPSWVKLSEQKQRSTRNPEKRRSTRPAGEEKPIEEETDVGETEAAPPEEATDAKAEATSETPTAVEEPAEAEKAAK